MMDPESSSTSQRYGSTAESGYPEQTTGTSSRQITPQRSKPPFMDWGGGHMSAGAPPPPTQRRGVGPSLSAGGAPPPSTHPDPSYVFIAGRNQGTFFSQPRRRPTTRPDRSVSLERLCKGVAVMGGRSPGRKDRSPQGSARQTSPKGSSRQTPTRQSSDTRRGVSPPRLSLSPSRMSSVGSAAPRHVCAWDRGVERFTSAPLKRQPSVSSVASDRSQARSSSCQSERSQRILEESKYPRSNSLYSLQYSSPIDQLQAKKVLNHSAERWSDLSRGAHGASDDSQSKVPMMYRRHPKLQAMETMITPRTAKDDESDRLQPSQTDAGNREKAMQVQQEVTALQAALAAADEKVMLHTKEIGALQAALAAADEKASKAATATSMKGLRCPPNVAAALPSWLAKMPGSSSDRDRIHSPRAMMPGSSSDRDRIHSPRAMMPGSSSDRERIHSPRAMMPGSSIDRDRIHSPRAKMPGSSIDRDRTHSPRAKMPGSSSDRERNHSPDNSHSHQSGRAISPKSPRHSPDVSSSHRAGRAPPICSGRLHQLQGSLDARVITPRGVPEPPLSPCDKPPLNLPGLDSGRGEHDSGSALHSYRSWQADDSESVHSSTCANADAAAGHDRSKVFKFDFGLEDDDAP